MPFFWIVVIIVVVWWLASRPKKTEPVSSPVATTEEETETMLTEEAVFKSQAYLENKISEEVDFPDAIHGYAVYVYKNLMRGWFQKLAADNRYNEEMTQQLRRDWVDYMYAIENRAKYVYLYMETPEETEPERAKSYQNKLFLAQKKMAAVEDGFASAVGPEAVKELKKIRELGENRNKFDKFGNLAPKGYEYDYEENLRKERD